MSTTSTKFSQSLNTKVFNFLNDLAKKENKTRADLIEEAMLLLEKQRRMEKLRDFHSKFLKSGKPLLGKDFKPNKMKKIDIDF